LNLVAEMKLTAVIGGSGLEQAGFLKEVKRHTITTPYGPPSSDIIEAELNSNTVFFLSRHGEQHTIAPHNINYRANIWALKSLGIKNIIAIAAVGGISENMPPSALMLPDQIIDYTWGREHTFFTSDNVEHIEFTEPYCDSLRQSLYQTCLELNIPVNLDGVYGATQGPRLETKAEIIRMQQDGCDIVGMTGMPEAALAKELGLCYATIAICANWAAGITPDAITMAEINKNLKGGMQKIVMIIKEFLNL